jgi:autotransporter-associated beta strand protein
MGAACSERGTDLPHSNRWRRRILAAAALGCAGLPHATHASPPNSSYKLVFADEFNETYLDTDKWTANSPSWTIPASDSVASASNVNVANGMLTLSANRPSATGSFTSGSISSYQKFNFSGGYVEASIQLPSTPGSWPAFWGLYNGWPPEADIMEYPLTTDGGTDGLKNNQYNTNYHYTNSSGAAAAGAGPVTTGSSLAGTWHTFGMLWTSNTSVEFYLDGNEVNSYTGSSVSQMASMYTIFDYVVGGWPGTPSTSQWAVGHTDQMNVDWVHIYQIPSSTATSQWKVSGGGSWGTAGNWTNGAPSYQDVTSAFGQVGSATAQSVTWSGPIASGGIIFGDPNNVTANNTSYTLGGSIGGGSQVQMINSGGTAEVQAVSTSTGVQTINADVDLYNNTVFENDMANGTLVLSGVLSDTGSLTVSGVGTTVFNNNNTYTGATYIGAGQGAAVALVTRSRPFGSTGLVTIGPGGNATTATVQIEDSRSIPNTINLCGRNNSTVAIESISGNNLVTGTINAQVGGGTYAIESDSGLLTLSGSTDATTPGVAIQSGAGGSRTFTLEGAGSGIVSGIIQNGSATAVSLIKTGAGTWTLASANTNTGSISITGGTLLLDQGGSIANANVNVSAGTLAGGTSGGGTVNFALAGDTANFISLSGTGVLNLTDLTLKLDVSGSQTQKQYVIANQDVGSVFVVGGAFEAVSGLPTGWSIDYNGTAADPGEIVLATPEPAGLCGAGIVVFCAFFFRPRKAPDHRPRMLQA